MSKKPRIPLEEEKTSRLVSLYRWKFLRGPPVELYYGEKNIQAIIGRGSPVETHYAERHIREALIYALETGEPMKSSMKSVEEYAKLNKDVEDELPEELLSKASISPIGEHAWRLEDVPDVIEAARVAGLSNVGGQPQFQGAYGKVELYHLFYGVTSDRKAHESWQSYVVRSASETLASFNNRCRKTDLERERQALRQAFLGNINHYLVLMDHLWFVLYFSRRPPVSRWRSLKKALRKMLP